MQSFSASTEMPILPYQCATALGAHMVGGVGLVRSALMSVSTEPRIGSMAIIFQLLARAFPISIRVVKVRGFAFRTPYRPQFRQNPAGQV
jgi:hypothetical protein